MQHSIIAVFAKSPTPGSVKTRLIPPLTPEQAASLHGAFVRDAIERCAAIPAVTCELHTDTESDAWPELDVARKLQIQGDLGLKMLHALDAALRAGAPVAAILGADVPDVPASYVEQILLSPADVTLGPAEDGGFYAIAARRVHPDMFRDVPWSTSETLVRTLAAVERCGLTAALGPVWYDVDEPADLIKLARTPNLPRHTREWLGRWQPKLV